MGQHCDKHLRAIGFEPIDNSDAWRSCYWHEKYGAFLVVYVDDFKMSCPTQYSKLLWDLIQKDTKDPVTGERITRGAELEEVETMGKFLGCNHIEDKNISPITGKEVKTITYDMIDFMKSCVQKYCDLAKFNVHNFKNVQTPFLDQGSDMQGRNACPGYCTECRAKCCSGNTKPVFEDSDSDVSTTAGETDSETEGDDDDDVGRLKPIASQVLMKIMYGARMARPDLLKAIGLLATKVTKWKTQQDRELHRLVNYIHCTQDKTLVAWCGDKLEDKNCTIC